MSRVFPVAPQSIGRGMALLSRVAFLFAATHRVRIADRALYLGDDRVCGVLGDGRLYIRMALTFDGRDVVTPKGLGRVVRTPGSPYATPERIAADIRARLAAEAAAPVPVACPTLSRDPEVSHA